MSPPAQLRSIRARGRWKILAGVALLASTATMVRPQPVAAMIEQGSLTVSGQGTMTSYPCEPCQVQIPVVTSGYMSGVDSSANPFTVTWGGLPVSTVIPASQLNFTLVQTCATGDEMTDITSLSGTLYVYSADLVYQGREQMVTLDVGLGTEPQLSTPDGAPIVAVTFTALVGSTPILSFFAGSAHGLFAFVPAGNNLCNPTGPMPYAVDGTTASAD